MTEPLGTYTFLPWLRRGIANRVQSAAGDPSVKLRASVNVSIDVEGALKAGGQTVVPVSRTVDLFGPGDIVGIERAAIQRTDPPDWVTNFEPNYLAGIEFYDEDFPWRYAPAAPAGRRLGPWLALVVLEEGVEFEEGGATTGSPLPFIAVSAALEDVMPDAGELWAWAHVHLNRALSDTQVVATDAAAVSAAAAGALAQNPDTAYARLLCPRKLAPSKAYHAFLIPAFESGRLAGLGIDPGPVFDDPATGLFATSSAWAAYPSRSGPTLFPYYHRWYFRTGARGDFEYLVRLLDPKPVDSRVGHRGMDVRNPAPNITGIDKPELNGVLRMGGALRAPLSSLTQEQRDEYDLYDNWADPYPQPFQSDLAAFVNLAATYGTEGPPPGSDPDPVITPPLYGRWHALTDRLLTKADGSPQEHLENWVHDLNLDPRWRAAAGLGTQVVQAGQEQYMAAAWEQIGEVLEANRRIRQAHVAQQAGKYWHARQLAAATATSDATGVTLFAPLHSRVISAGLSVKHRVRRSPVSVAMTSSAMRRVMRPRGRVARRLGLQPERDGADLLSRANLGEIVVAPPKGAPRALPTPDAIADALRDDDKARRDVESLREQNQTPKSVDELPGSRRFAVTSEVDLFTRPKPFELGGDEPDGPEAQRFKTALRGAYTLVQESERLGRVPPRLKVDLPALAADLLAATDPALTVPRWVLNGVSIPQRIRDQIGERFVEAMAYPEFDTAMYRPLADLGDELFVPNINLVEPDSVTLLETNQEFVESYMVGLNHEFARELLWREYPTDQRGSYFRRFWDSRTQADADKDIPPLHLWPQDSDLGDHDLREQGMDNEEELVLVIRGELLKKYPNTVTTAQRAKWQLKDGEPDKSQERRLDDSSPPLTPLYEARIAPDIYFFGFDLTVEEAAGDDTVDDKPGWFFRIEEVPGDARFGFDIEREGALNVWNDLSWPDVIPGVVDGAMVRVAGIPPHTLEQPTGDVAEKLEQWDSDRQVPLTSAVSSAELAYIALQVPVLMAIHASELLPDG